MSNEITQKMVESFIGDKESIHAEAMQILESGVEVVKDSLRDLTIRADKFLQLHEGETVEEICLCLEEM